MRCWVMQCSWPMISVMDLHLRLFEVTCAVVWRWSNFDLNNEG